MNLRFLIQNNLLQSLGWSLVDSLWQMGALWLAYQLLTNRGTRFSARSRHNLALIASTSGTLLFFISFFVRLFSTNPATGFLSLYSNTLSGFLPVIQELLRPTLPVLSILYLISLALLLIRFSRQYYYTTRLLQEPGQKAPAALRVYLEQTALRLGIKRPVSLRISDRVSSPFTLGFWKPVILLPLASLNQLSIAQTEAILLHELEHINGNDYLINLLVTGNDLLFFFNPFTRQLSRALVRERENHCDDRVLSFRYNAADYAQALLLLEQQRSIPLLAPAANGNGQKLLLQRMERILLGKAQPRHSLRLSGLLAVFLLLGLVSSISPALLEEKPALLSGILTPALTPKPQTQTVRAGRFIEKKEVMANTEAAHAETNTTVDETDYTETNFLEFPIAEPATISVAGMPARNYSIEETEKEVNTEEPADNGFTFEPYVPANSFRYQIQNDTLPDTEDIAKIQKSIDELNQTLKTLDALNLKPLEEKLKSVELDKLTSEALKAEIRKAITAQYESELKQMQNQLALNQFYYKQLESTRKKQLDQKQQQLKQQQQVLEYRLMEGRKVKKVVVI